MQYIAHQAHAHGYARQFLSIISTKGFRLSSPSNLDTFPMIHHWQRMFAYEIWANARTIESLRSVPTAQRETAEYRRAQGLLAHNTLARQVWLWRINAVTYTNPSDWFPVWDDASTVAQIATVDAQWAAFLASHSEQDLARELHYNASDGTAYSSTVGEVCEHVFNHSTYHRGQIARIVHLLGGVRAGTDLIAFSRKTR